MRDRSTAVLTLSVNASGSPHLRDVAQAGLAHHFDLLFANGVGIGAGAAGGWREGLKMRHTDDATFA